MRALDTFQTAAVVGPVTTPQYLIQITLDQPYYWSTRNQIAWDGQTWALGGVKVGMVSSNSAELLVENEDYRLTMDALAGSFMRSTVKIWWAYQSLEDVYYVESGYWEDGYIDDGAVTADPILLFDGVIHACPTVEEWIAISARRTPPKYYPYAKIRPPIANHLPGNGYQLTFDSNILTVESAQ